MKFKFVKEVQDIVAKIAALPSQPTSNTSVVLPIRIVNDFEKDIMIKKTHGEISERDYPKLRRHMTFLYELVRTSCTMESVLRLASLPDYFMLGIATEAKSLEVDALDTYRVLVELCKGVLSGKSLDHPHLVKAGFSYGVIVLSDYEINKLIEKRSKK